MKAVKVEAFGLVCRTEQEAIKLEAEVSLRPTYILPPPRHGGEGVWIFLTPDASKYIEGFAPAARAISTTLRSEVLTDLRGDDLEDQGIDGWVIGNHCKVVAEVSGSGYVYSVYQHVDGDIDILAERVDINEVPGEFVPAAYKARGEEVPKTPVHEVKAHMDALAEKEKIEARKAQSSDLQRQLTAIARLSNSAIRMRLMRAGEVVPISATRGEMLARASRLAGW
jgi:hypothetical protein